MPHAISPTNVDTLSLSKKQLYGAIIICSGYEKRTLALVTAISPVQYPISEEIQTLAKAAFAEGAKLLAKIDAKMLFCRDDDDFNNCHPHFIKLKEKVALVSNQLSDELFKGKTLVAV